MIFSFVQKRLNEVKAKIAADTTEKHINDMSIIEKLLKNHHPKYAFSTILDILFGGVDTVRMFASIYRQNRQLISILVV